MLQTKGYLTVLFLMLLLLFELFSFLPQTDCKKVISCITHLGAMNLGQPQLTALIPSSYVPIYDFWASQCLPYISPNIQFFSIGPILLTYFMGRSCSPFNGYKESCCHDNIYPHRYPHSLCCVFIKNYLKSDLVQLKTFCTRKKQVIHQTMYVTSKEEHERRVQFCSG